MQKFAVQREKLVCAFVESNGPLTTQGGELENFGSEVIRLFAGERGAPMAPQPRTEAEN